MAPSFTYGGNKFQEIEVLQGIPRRIPKSIARGGAGVAVKNVKAWVRMMKTSMDYCEMLDCNVKRIYFKSPFDRRPLIGPRAHSRKNEEKRTLRLVGSSDPVYLRLCEEALFTDIEDEEEA